MTDQFLLSEKKRLQELIKHKDLYRKGDFLYDPEFIEPRYSILGFVWGFCKCPSIACKLNEYLLGTLKDIPDLSMMSKSDLFSTLGKLLNHRLQPQRARRFNVCVFGWLVLQNRSMFLKNLKFCDTFKRKMCQFYYEDNWQPGKDFYERFSGEKIPKSPKIL